MRVLIVDQDSEMLEAVARAFEVDVATSKASCIDLLRVTEFDVVIACERLGDGSGLELLSQIGKRWPTVLRVLSIERSRGAQLRGKLLGPFKLFATLPYPIVEDKLEAVLDRAHAELAMEHVPSVSASVDADSVRVQHIAASASPARQLSPTRPVKPPVAKPHTAQPSRPALAQPSSRAAALPSLPAGAKLSSPAAAQLRTGYTPPRRSSSTKFVPLGAPDEPGYRILPHDSFRSDEPLERRALRRAPVAPRRAAFHQRAAAVAAEAVAALAAVVGRYMKPPEGKPVSGKTSAHRASPNRQEPSRSASSRSAVTRPPTPRTGSINRPAPDPRTPRKR